MRAASLLLVAFAAGAAPAAAQHADSAQSLPDLSVTVTRAPAPASRVGASVSVVDSMALHRLRLAPALDEALAFVPGLILQNRGNYSLDEQIAIRGFGARANFGLRGVEVVIDGVPQTLPDGQSQLNNLDLGVVNRVEVLRGGASSLYGNAAGGVLAFSTRVTPDTPWEIGAGYEGGSFGSSKSEVSAAGRSGPLGGAVTLSRFAVDGYREQSATEQRRLNAGIDWTATGATLFTLRVSSADDPHARNPGALTAAEFSRNPDSAAAGNILRGADKSVDQTQVAFGMTHDDHRWHVAATLFGLTRDLINPLATPPPIPTTPAEGTWSGINRLLGGARMSATLHLGGTDITGGADAQALRDDRVNRRSVGGVATDTLLVDQREQVSEAALFAQVSAPISSRWTLRGGARQDINRFSVTDHLLTDGDASGARGMSATSGNAGIAYQLTTHATVWTNVATVFQTPTTTELANRPDGGGGFNPDLGPERSVTAELGVRAGLGRLALEGAIYHTNTDDAIVPYSDVDGRSFFRNAGSTRTEGAEASVIWKLSNHVTALATWTYTDAIFSNYGLVNGTAIDTLTGNTLAGIPHSVGRVGLQGSIGLHVTFDVDQGWSSGMFADDDNSIAVAGWGVGVTGVRVGWQGTNGRWTLQPYLAALNIFDRRYVGSVTIDGAGGRVFEPASPRTVFVGMHATIN